jgi:hypothetical protein
VLNVSRLCAILLTFSMEKTGEFFEGFPTGNGLWSWSDGSFYIGQLNKQKRNGSGMHQFPDGYLLIDFSI